MSRKTAKYHYDLVAISFDQSHCFNFRSSKLQSNNKTSFSIYGNETLLIEFQK